MIAFNIFVSVMCYHVVLKLSILFLFLQLFDALFQIHCVEGHRGKDACKNVADSRYANIPDSILRAFFDTCPKNALKSPKRASQLAEDVVRLENHVEPV